jgi:hypothetical protein
VKELRSRSRKDWFIDSGLVLLYSVFLTANFFIGFVHVYHDDLLTWSWISGFLVILVSPCISYLLNDFGRTIAIFFLSSFLGFALESITSVILFFHSFWFYRYLERTNEIGELASPAQLILIYTISVFFISVLGAIVGCYIAERRHKGEKVLSLRCSRCGTWNEQDAVKCSFCKKELVEERYAAEARTRTA